MAQARAQGRPVFVDFTADWCLTCQANKRIAIDIPSVRAKLKQTNAVALLGDYTRLPDDITTELNRFGRAGVPLVLVYSKNPNQAARGVARGFDTRHRAGRPRSRCAVKFTAVRRLQKSPTHASL